MYHHAMPETIGMRIRAARLAAGYSLRGLAKTALGRSSNARLISNWEKGDNTPSLRSLHKIAPHLNLTVADLIHESTFNNREE